MQSSLGSSRTRWATCCLPKATVSDSPKADLLIVLLLPGTHRPTLAILSDQVYDLTPGEENVGLETQVGQGED